MDKKKKIISIIAEPPPYTLHTHNPRPKISWNTTEGDWVGIWPTEWADQLGSEILKLTGAFDYEVWQVDLKADRIYSHIFNNGLTHRIFPSKKKKRMYGLRVINEIYSKVLIEELLACSKKEKIIVHLHGNIRGVTKEVLSKKGNFPVILWNNGEITLPSTKFFKLNKNIFCKLNMIAEHLWLIKNINKINLFIYCNSKHLSHLIRIYHGEKINITPGCDHSFWVKVDKQACRKVLNLPQDAFILLSVCRLVSGKQVDRFIQVLNGLSRRHEFLYLLAGSGESKYVDYLRRMARPLLETGKMKFVGFLEKEKLLKYYNAADMFVSTSLSEGAQVSAMQAFACETPVFSTKTGGTAELMEERNVDVLVSLKDCEEWKKELEKILKTRKLPATLDRDVAKEYFDWPNVARQFLTIYQKL